MNTPDPTTESLWSDLNAELRRFLVARTGDRHAAEDLLQETFVRIHGGLARLPARAHLRGWVYQIARNLVIDHYRWRKEPVADDALETGAAEDENLNGLVGGWVQRSVDELPETYREAVRLSEIQELPQQEIATRLHLSLSATKSRIQRGRRLLREQIEACCALQFDRRGNVIDYQRRRDECQDC